MSVPEDEERLLPLAQRWPRASKFLLSGCAATVAELGTQAPTPGPLRRVAEAPRRVVVAGAGSSRAGGTRRWLGSPVCAHARLRPLFHTCPADVGATWQGQVREEEGLEVTKVFIFQFLLQRCAIVPERVLLEAS